MTEIVGILSEIITQNVVPQYELDGIRTVYTKGNTHVIELRNYYLGTWVSKTEKGLTRRWQLFSKTEYNVNMVLQEINRAKGRTAQHYIPKYLNLKKYNKKRAHRLHERNRKVLQDSI